MRCWESPDPSWLDCLSLALVMRELYGPPPAGVDSLAAVSRWADKLYSCLLEVEKTKPRPCANTQVMGLPVGLLCHNGKFYICNSDDPERGKWLLIGGYPEAVTLVMSIREKVYSGPMWEEEIGDERHKES